MQIDFFFVLIPSLFVLLSLAGMTIALMYRRSCPTACRLLFTASLLHLFATLIQLDLMFNLAGPDGFLVSFAARILQWIAYGLLLMAIFADRPEPPRQETLPSKPLPEDDDDWPPSIAKPSTGIQGR